MPNDPELNNEIDFEGSDPNQPANPLNKNQKIAAASLAAFAILIIILWAVELRNNIYGPFNANTSGNLAATEAADQTLALKNKDTDGDGLTDYDELNVYKTSPYLADTDSDGLSDSAEIKNNTDPNCPQGRTCVGGLLDNSAQATSTAGTTSDALSSLLNQFGATAAAGQATGGTTNLNSDRLNALKNIDAASLRQLLLQAGMDKATLDKISDQQLLQSFQETLKGE